MKRRFSDMSRKRGSCLLRANPCPSPFSGCDVNRFACSQNISRSGRRVRQGKKQGGDASQDFLHRGRNASEFQRR